MTVERVRIGELLELKREAIPVQDDATYRTIGLFNRGRGIFERPAVSGAETKYPTYYAVHPEQLVFSKLFAWEGSVAVVPPSATGLVASPEFPTFDVPTDRILPRYLHHAVGSEGFIEQLRGATVGMGQRRQRVNIDGFQRAEIPLPPLAEQRRIADHLDAVERRVDGVPSKAAVERRLETVVNRVLERAGGKPVYLGSLLERDREWITLDSNETYRPVGVRGFGRGLIRYPAASREDLSKLRYFRLTPGSLLVSNIKAWEGAATTIRQEDEGRVASNRFLQYRTKGDQLSVQFLSAVLTSSVGVELLSSASPGSADRNRTLSMERFEALQIRVPSRAAQERVIEVARHRERILASSQIRDMLTGALLPAARNEIFSAL